MEYRFVGPGSRRDTSLWSLVVFYLVLIGCATTAVDYPPAYPTEIKTVFACQDSYAYLNCTSAGEKIRVVRANYGRFSLVICNKQGVHSGWELQCAASTSLQVVTNSCDGKQSCTFIASNKLFGDPCPGTEKYIEVRYYCEKEERTTTPRVTTEESLTSSVPSLTEVITKPVRTKKPPRTTQKPAVITPHMATKPPGPGPKKPTRWTEPPYRVVKVCESEVAATIPWPSAPVGRTVEMDCPGGKKGVALWTCGKKGWIGSPDVSNCVSQWMKDIESMIEEDVPVASAMVKLNNKIKSKPLGVGDLKKATNSLLPGMVHKMRKQMDKSMPAKQRREMVQTFTKEVVKTGSELLGNQQKESWKQLDSSERKKSGTSLILSMEALALEVASTIDEPSTVASSEENVFMEVSVIQTDNYRHRNLQLPTKRYHSAWMDTKDSVVLPLDAFPNINRKRDVSVTFLLYHNLDELLGLNEESSSESSDVPPPTHWVINTNVISASVNGLSIRSPVRGHDKIHLSRPMNFTLDHQMVYDDYRPVCCFWDIDDSGETGQWSEEGCRAVETSSTHTVCQCDHLTNFAVLFDVSGTKLEQHHELSLKAITYVGCTVSIICLFICFISFSIFRNIQSDRNTIHKNLVLCLMIAELLFLFGIGQTSDKLVCGIIAGCLHFFFLTAFSWMCLEGIQLYFMLIEVFEAERSRVRWFYLFGYGVPAVIVAIAAGVDHTGYGTDTHCWLRTDNYFILSFVIPAGIVIMINIVMLGIAVYMMCRHANITASRAREKGRLEKMGDQRPLSKTSVVSDTDTKSKLELPTWLKGSAVLVVLLGLTWCFGFMYVNQDSLVMAYIFTILNSLQGLFIFIFHCFMDRKVKKEYRKAIQRSSWLPGFIRVNCGGYTGNLPSSSSTGQNYFFLRFWSSRKRKRSSASSGSGKSRQRRSDLDSYLPDSSSRCTTTGTGVNRYSNQSDKLLPPEYNKLPTCYEDGVKGDLSVIDCSMVDSEFVTTYCQENLQVSREERRYSSGSDDNVDNADNVSISSITKHRLSYLSQDSALKNQSDFASSDNEDGGISYSELNNREYSVPRDGSHLDQTESETNLLNNLITFVKGEKVLTNGKVLFPSLDELDSKRESASANMNRSAPDLKFTVPPPALPEQVLDLQTQPLLGSLPDMSSNSEEDPETDSDHFSRSARMAASNEAMC